MSLPGRTQREFLGAQHKRTAMSHTRASAGATGSRTAQARLPWRTRQRGGFAIGLVAGLLIGLALALGVALYITKAPVPFVNKVPQRTAEQDTAETERNRNWDPNAPLGGKSAARPLGPAAVPVEGMASGAGVVAGAPSGPTAVRGLPLPLPLPLPGPGSGPGPGPGPASFGSAGSGTPTPVIATARDPAAILAGSTTTPPPSFGTHPPAPTAGTPGLGAARPVAPTAAATAISDPFVYFVQAGAFNRGEEAEQQRAKLALMGQSAKITEREQAGRTIYRVRLGPYATRDEADVLQGQMQQQGIGVQLVRVEKP
jgi:cell division protein FtsN